VFELCYIVNFKLTQKEVIFIFMKIELSPFDDFDKALSLNRDANTEFVLKKDEVYKTKGNWYYSDWHTLAPKCKLRGEGAKLMLDVDNVVKSVGGVVRPDRDLNVFWTSDSVVEDLTIIGNEEKFKNLDPSKTWHVTSGIRSTDGPSVFRNLTVEGIRGSFSSTGTIHKEIEAFPISIVGKTGGGLIENCVVQNCPEQSYVSAFYPGFVGNNLKTTIVKNCKVDIGKNNWFGFGVNCNVEITGCEILNGVRFAIYNDTDITENIVVNNCKFNNIEKLISMIIPPGSNHQKTNIQIKNTEIMFSDGPTRHLVELWDQNNNSSKRQMGPVLLKNVTTYPVNKNTKVYVAVVSNDLRPIIATDCNFPFVIENLAGNNFVNF
jgi:hypothetical protein